MPEEKKTEKKKLITPEIRKIWFPIRKAWSISVPAFSNAISSLNDKQAGILYDIVKLALYKSYWEILRQYPGMKEIMFSDDDRLCMYQIYENLSWRLGKKEPEPKDVKLIEGLKGGIGRQTPHIEL